jgi:hypothetical protein
MPQCYRPRISLGPQRDERQIALPGLAAKARSKSEIGHVGGRLHASYTFSQGLW